MKKLFAWFPNAGRLEVDVPETYEDAAEYRAKITTAGSRSEWVDLKDGSRANVGQIVRLELADD